MDINQLIGLSKQDAIVRIKDQGYQARVVSIDGKGMIITRDLRSDRINLKISSDVVSGVYIG